LPEKVDDILWLTRLAHQAVVLLFRNHHHTFFPVATNALWALVARAAEDLAEPGFGGLNLPGFAGGLGVA
jgi:hypothetical protein